VNLAAHSDFQHDEVGLVRSICIKVSNLIYVPVNESYDLI
jgi:hypothetical protein